MTPAIGELEFEVLLNESALACTQFKLLKKGWSLLDGRKGPNVVAFREQPKLSECQEWSNCGNPRFRFDECLILYIYVNNSRHRYLAIATINRRVVVSKERRKHERVDYVSPATIELPDGSYWPCIVFNLSRGGAMIGS